jgi:ubiquitin carboxyl-terminal hydrolase 48
MAPFNRKSDKQWRFLGQEVTALNDLTSNHIRAVYGLGPKKQIQNTNDMELDSKNTSIFPYCGNQYALPECEDTKKSNTCSVSRCKESNPHCLNYMGQDQWEGEGIMMAKMIMISSDSRTIGFSTFVF